MDQEGIDHGGQHGKRGTVMPKGKVLSKREKPYQKKGKKGIMRVGRAREVRLTKKYVHRGLEGGMKGGRKKGKRI